MRNVVIIGASGHGRVIADIVLKSGDNVVGFLDDDTTLGSSCCGFPILGVVSDYEKIKDCSFVIGIGNPNIREKFSNKVHGTFYTAIHPSAQISKLDVTIGEGSVIMANAVVNSGAHIGRHCIINSNAVVEHDNKISDFAHISVGAKVAGTVAVGYKTWVGIGATISNDLSICDNCMIGAGAVVVRSISESGTYVGFPARRIK